jgi:hypothetical protein
MRLPLIETNRGFACFAAFGAGAIAGLLVLGDDATAVRAANQSPAVDIQARFLGDAAFSGAPSYQTSESSAAMDEPAAPEAFAMVKGVAEPSNEPEAVRVASVYPPWALASVGSRTVTLSPVAGATRTPVEVPADRSPIVNRGAGVEREANIERVLPKTPAAPRAAPNRPGALFNDAQIASIKSRLKLTPDQQRHWPAVETALRDISWRRTGPERKGPGTVPGTLDPGGVERLKSAAIPLIMTLREDQKSEVRKLAHLMGLDQVASQI